MSVVGMSGMITVATKGKDGPGEVVLNVNGGTEFFIAWSSEPLPRGTSVIIVDNKGARTVQVSTWNDPL